MQSLKQFGYVKLFEALHVSIAKLAQKHLEIDFVIKTKWLENWLVEINYVFNKHGYQLDQLENLIVTDSIDAHELIFSSDVICGFASTTLIEAAVSGKPVIMPYFAEATELQYQGYVHYAEDPGIFDIAESQADFEHLIMERLQHPEVDSECMQRRYQTFTKYVSSLDADALQRYTRVIQGVVHDKKSKAFS